MRMRILSKKYLLVWRKPASGGLHRATDGALRELSVNAPWCVWREIMPCDDGEDTRRELEDIKLKV